MKLTICKSPNGAVALRSDRGQVCEMLAGYDQTRLQDAQTIAHRVNVHDELVAALEILASIPLEDFGHEKRKDSQSLMGWNNVTLTVGHVRAARAALERAKQ